VVKIFGHGPTRVVALNHAQLVVSRGEFVAVMGPSGSGKSTLMHCLAGLDRVTSGRVVIEDTDLGTLEDKALTRFRRNRVGFVFQSFNLLPALTARENILLPMRIAAREPDPQWWTTIVDITGLGDRLHHRPAELSGGQQQRVACARALLSRPAIVFADEPTGNLDTTSSAELLAFLRRSVEQFQQTMVIVTHDPRAASFTDRVVFLADGSIVSEMANPTADGILETMKTLDRSPRPSPVLPDSM